MLVTLIIIAAVGFGLVLLVVGGIVAWLLLGSGPRRSRAYKAAQRQLQEGRWQEALAAFETLNAQANLPPDWQGKLRHAAGECHQFAADLSLQEKRYEQARIHAVTAAPLLGVSEADQQARVVEQMLAEVRRQFAAGPAAVDTSAVLQLIDRVFPIQTPCPEASFWQGLCRIRQNDTDRAIQSLTTAFEQAGKQFLDPALYLGMVLHRAGKPADALRFLAEANRVDGNCAFVTLQMGSSIVAAGGDMGLAVRALQRALGPRGLPLWAQTPDRAWVEAFPEAKSYVRRLASKNPYSCPILGNDLAAIARFGRIALAQALYRQGTFGEAADLYGKLLQEMPPTPPLLRGYGLALARQGKYDQAYKHLRTALEQEEPKDAFTAGYLALCGAMGKPTQADDKPKNITWGIKLLSRFQMMGNPEWASLYSAVFAEARSIDMPLPVEDLTRLCDVLASVQAADAQAAAGYMQLLKAYPDAVLPVHAWNYCRAVEQHGVRIDGDLEMFARTFRNSAPARQYYGRQNWSFDDLEYLYLERGAAQAPGAFPEPLGPDYPPQGEAFLLERSRKEEEANKRDAALACVEVLLKLSPNSIKGHDRLACLHYRRGDMDRAVALLAGWHQLAPHDHWPLVRQAIIEQQRGNAERRAEAIDRALGLTRGSERASVAFLGAKLALKESVTTPGARPEALSKSMALLQECLREDPDHVEALWCLAAVRSCVGDHEGLAQQASQMDRAGVQDSRFHFMAAVCSLAAKDYARVLERGERAAADDALAVESHYLMAWAHLHLDNQTAASQSLQKVAVTKSPSADFARALLGKLSFARGAYDDAIKWWNQVDAKRRAEWKFDESLRQTTFLAGLLAYETGRFEQAEKHFREAGKLGLREKRLGSLLTLALVRAGQRLLFEDVKK
jgi:tetratricopeptide (TPR) repeat protein